MAAGTTYPLGLTVAPTREHAPLLLRIASTILITLATAIALGVPLLVSGVTGFNLWHGEGQSMVPTLRPGVFVVTQQVAPAELEPGDIIMFEGDRSQVMHRIVSVEAGADGRTFITRGDNNDANDPPVPESAVIGKLVHEVTWLPRIPMDLSGTGLFVLEWLASVSLFTMGIIIRRNPTRPSRAAIRRSYMRFDRPYR